MAFFLHPQGDESRAHRRSKLSLDNNFRHRITVMGPGTTPVIRWEGARLGPYDRMRDAAINQIFDDVLTGDAKCALER